MKNLTEKNSDRTSQTKTKTQTFQNLNAKNKLGEKTQKMQTWRDEYIRQGIHIHSNAKEKKGDHTRETGRRARISSASK